MLRQCQRPCNERSHGTVVHGGRGVVVPIALQPLQCNKERSGLRLARVVTKLGYGEVCCTGEYPRFRHSGEKFRELHSTLPAFVGQEPF